MTAEAHDPVRTVAPLQRREGMPLEDFHRYWRDVHAPIVERIPGITRYILRHVMRDAPGTDAEDVFGVDGIAVLEYESEDAFASGWETEAAEAALADAANFLGRVTVLRLRDTVIVDVPQRTNESEN